MYPKAVCICVIHCILVDMRHLASCKSLQFTSHKVDDSNNGFHYASAIMDYPAIYRQFAVFELRRKGRKCHSSCVHQHVQTLLAAFLQHREHLKQYHIKIDYRGSRLRCLESFVMEKVNG